ncbi:MAG: hypothetical protein P4M11_03775 [Candidatus Pacebacteria bacterium]|nr:hypothetical protein [Candidatus Paceibacterota bacterium]
MKRSGEHERKPRPRVLALPPIKGAEAAARKDTNQLLGEVFPRLKSVPRLGLVKVTAACKESGVNIERRPERAELPRIDNHILIYIRKHRNDRDPGKLELISRSMRYAVRDKSQRPTPTGLDSGHATPFRHRGKGTDSSKLWEDEDNAGASKDASTFRPSPEEQKQPAKPKKRRPQAQTRRPSEEEEVVVAESLPHLMPSLVNYGNKLE